MALVFANGGVDNITGERLFESKYGEKVKTYSIGEFSKEMLEIYGVYKEAYLK